MCTESFSGDTWNGCPVCKGYGRVPTVMLPALGGAVESLPEVPPRPEGLLCIACAGTGNQRAYRELLAYRMGIRAGFEAMSRAMPDLSGTMGLDALQRALDEQETEAAWERPVE